MLYEDPETGLAIRRINYDSKDEAYCDIRVIDSHAELVKSLGLPQPVDVEVEKCWETGTSQRLDRIETSINFKIYLILDGQFMIATASTSRVETYYPVIIAGTISEARNKIQDVYFALGRMCKKELAAEKVYAMFEMRAPFEKFILAKTKRFIMNYPKIKPYLQIWELNI